MISSYYWTNNPKGKYMKIEMYSKDFCQFCTKAEALLNERGLPFTTIKIASPQAKEDLLERVETSGGVPPRTVPQIFIDDNHIGGYTDLVAWFSAQDGITQLSAES